MKKPPGKPPSQRGGQQHSKPNPISEPPPSVLYHFTNRPWWQFIKSEGINRGECPLTRRRVVNWPNFTTDPIPSNQGWANSSSTNKRSVRITVAVRPGDAKWAQWLQLVYKYGMDDATIRDYVRTGGTAENWWIYRGIVSPSEFVAVDFFDAITPSDMDNKYIDMIDKSGASSYEEFIQSMARRPDGFSRKDTRYLLTRLGEDYPIMG